MGFKILNYYMYMHVYVESQDREHKIFKKRRDEKYCRFASLGALVMITKKTYMVNV